MHKLYENYCGVFIPAANLNYETKKKKEVGKESYRAFLGRRTSRRKLR